MAVGRAWASPRRAPTGDEAGRLAADMAALGAPAEVAAAAAAAATPAPAEGALEVWPDNEGAVTVFLAMGTQWRRAGMAGVPTGLDYAALPAVCRAQRRRLDADLLTRLQVIEMAAIRAMLERARD